MVVQHIKLCLLVLGIAVLSCSENKDGIKPRVSDLTESVYASVKLEPKGYYDVYAASSGILEEILIEEGDTVSNGQIIAKIKADNPAVLRDNAQLNAELARENYQGQSNLLGTMHDEIRSIEEQVHVDSLNYTRLKRLWSQNIGSRSDLENAELKYELNKNNLDILKSRYTQTQNDLENRYRQAQNALKQAQTSLGDYNITSRVDGKVYSVLREAGELITAQQALAQIGHADEFIIDMSIDEVDIARLHIGQKVWVSLDAYEGEVYEALITRILPLKDERTQTFSVEALFTKPPDVLYAGLSGEANIVINKKENVLSIPLDLLIEDSKVLTADGEVEVQTGLRNLEYVEILSGIDSTTVLYRPE